MYSITSKLQTNFHLKLFSKQWSNIHDDKNIARHKVHSIVSWHNRKRQIGHTSDLMMIIR